MATYLLPFDVRTINYQIQAGRLLIHFCSVSGDKILTSKIKIHLDMITFRTFILFRLMFKGTMRVNPLTSRGWTLLILGKLFWLSYRILIPIFYLNVPLVPFWTIFCVTELVTSWHLGFCTQVSIDIPNIVLVHHLSDIFYSYLRLVMSRHLVNTLMVT